MSERPWRIDYGLAADLAGALGWAPAEGAGVLARRFAERVPTGSTAKLAALAEGRVPPGADVEALAQRILEALTGVPDASAGAGEFGNEPGVMARVPDASAGAGEFGSESGAQDVSADAGADDDRRVSPAWTCWVVSSVFAAIVDTLGPATARVAALRRIDERSPVVDIHSVVVVESGQPGEAATWVCDPYFGAAVSVPGGLADRPDPSPAPDRHPRPPDHASSPAPNLASRPDIYPSLPDEHAGACAVTLEGSGRWSFAVRLRVWDGWLRYRMLAPQLDRADLAAFCAISATHSGAPDFAYARLHRPGGMDTVRVDPEGTTTLSRRCWDSPHSPVSEERTTRRSWLEGVAAFAAATGVTIGE